eukprot:3500346-Ditylum_brightwellii.AAC.1
MDGIDFSKLLLPGSTGDNSNKDSFFTISDLTDEYSSYACMWETVEAKMAMLTEAQFFWLTA